MSHFYAFDRKQSLALLFAGILLAILALMLGWIIGLLMRPPIAPAPETVSRPPSATPSASAESPAEDAPGPAEKADASGSLAEAIPPEAKPRESSAGTGSAASGEGGSSRDSSGTGSETSAEDAETDFGPRTRYAVVVADFVVESKARELVKTLEEKGYAGRVVHTPPERTAGRMGIYTVILGDYARSTTAEVAAERFAERESISTAVRRFPALALLPPPSPPPPPSAAEPMVPPNPGGNPESGADG